MLDILLPTHVVIDYADFYLQETLDSVILISWHESNQVMSASVAYVKIKYFIINCCNAASKGEALYDICLVFEQCWNCKDRRY